MRTFRGVIALVLALVLVTAAAVAPSAAFGQSAGDDQYVDPFEGDGNGGGQGGNGNSGSGEGNSGGGDGSETTTAPPPASTGETTAESALGAEATTSAQSDGPTLPRSGLPLAGLFAGGLLLLAGGAALRRRA